MSELPSYTQVGTHLADPDTVDAIRVHTGGAGLILGSDEHGRPVAVAFIRPEPTAVVMVGYIGVAQLVAVRALALGAAVLVSTVRPSAWSALSRAGADMPDVVDIVWPDTRPERYGSSLRPQLLFFDSYSTAAVGAAPTMYGWSTIVTVREQLAPRDANLLARADLIVTQRLSLQESTLLCRAVNIPEYTHALPALPVSDVAVITRTAVRRARLGPTAIEQQLIGPLARG